MLDERDVEKNATVPASRVACKPVSYSLQCHARACSGSRKGTPQRASLPRHDALARLKDAGSRCRSAGGYSAPCGGVKVQSTAGDTFHPRRRVERNLINGLPRAGQPVPSSWSTGSEAAQEWMLAWDAYSR